MRHEWWSSAVWAQWAPWGVRSLDDLGGTNHADTLIKPRAHRLDSPESPEPHLALSSGSVGKAPSRTPANGQSSSRLATLQKLIKGH